MAINTAADLERALIDLLVYGDTDALEENHAKTITFEEAHLLTREKGVVIRFRNGAEFQLGIIQSKRAAAVAECGFCDEAFEERDEYVMHLIGSHGYSADEAEDEADDVMPE